MPCACRGMAPSALGIRALVSLPGIVRAGLVLFSSLQGLHLSQSLALGRGSVEFAE